METFQLNPVEVAAYVSAGALAGSKLFTAVKPLWNRLPRWLAVALPVMILDLPQVSQLFSGTTTANGLFTALVASLALVLPGLAEAEHPSDKQPAPAK
jgi:hypothetical protein